MRWILVLLLCRATLAYGDEKPSDPSIRRPDGSTPDHSCWIGQYWSEEHQRCEQECRDGKVVTDDTHGYCCWPGQAWSSDRERCVGAPTRCPDGLRVNGDSCRVVEALEYADDL